MASTPLVGLSRPPSAQTRLSSPALVFPSPALVPFPKPCNRSGAASLVQRFSRDQELLPRHVRWHFVSHLSFNGPTIISSNLSSEHDENTQNNGHGTLVVEEKVNDETDKKESDVVASTDLHMINVCDKLIDVFMVDKPNTTDWRRLLAFSREWVNIRAHFYKRCQERAEAEDDLGMKQALLRLSRKLREVDEDVERHNGLLVALKEASTDITGLVRRRRKDFTREFFEHLHAVAASYHDSPDDQKVLMDLQSTCLTAIEAHDNASETIEALNAAELKFVDIMKSPTLNDACRKIDNLAQKNQLDSALMLMLTKAWSGAKQTDMTENEAKDVLYYLYKTAMKDLETQVPKETRILRRLLKIQDPEELISNLNDAFTPGTADGSLYTTPHELFAWIQMILDAYNNSRQGTLLGEAKDLLDRDVIHRLEELKTLIRDKFM